MTYQRLENFLLSRCSSEDMSIQQTKQNEWIIETTTKLQSESYMQITKIDNVNVKVTKHDTLNSIQHTYT